MDLVEHEEVGVERPGARLDDGTVVEDVEVQVLGLAEFGHDALGQIGFADLAGTCEQDHFFS
jgi:hypothetical protein